MAGKFNSIMSSVGRSLVKGAKIGLAVGLCAAVFTLVTAATGGLAFALGAAALTAINFSLGGAFLGAVWGGVKGIIERPVPDAEALMGRAPSCGTGPDMPGMTSEPAIAPQVAPQACPKEAAPQNPGKNAAQAAVDPEELRHFMAQMQGAGAAPVEQKNWQERSAQPAVQGHQR